MNGKLPQKYKKLFLVTLVAVIVYVVLKFLLPLVLPFVFAYFICRLLYPAALWLSKKLHVPKTLSSVVLVGGLALGIMAGTGGGIWYLVKQTGRLAQDMDRAGQWFGPDVAKTVRPYCIFGRPFSGIGLFLHVPVGVKIYEHDPGKASGSCRRTGGGCAKGIGTFFIIFVVAIVGRFF